jgi:hypothetical protein
MNYVTYGVVPSFYAAPQFKVTNEMPYPPPAYRRPAHWAQLHAGIQYIVPVWERNALIWLSCGVPVREIADGNRVSAPEVRAAIARVERTLATWEREQDSYATRYPIREPTSLLPDGAGERDRTRDGSSAPHTGWQRHGHRVGRMESG